MFSFTLHQLHCFSAVIRQGSFKAAAQALNRTHPSVYAATKMLEEQLGVKLFERGGYRVELTRAGRAFHGRVRVFLDESTALKAYAEQLSRGEETEFSLVIGDVSPLTETLKLLKVFFGEQPNTRFDLHFEVLAGPLERLLEGSAELIIHHIDPGDTRLETIHLDRVCIIPVVAPGLLDFPIHAEISPEMMRTYPQIIIRDSALHSAKKNYYLIEGARQWTVGDQLTKKEIIHQGMGWGHLPDFMIRDELESGELVPLTGRYFQGGTVQISAVRLRKKPHGPIANRLWRYLGQAMGMGEMP